MKKSWHKKLNFIIRITSILSYGAVKVKNSIEIEFYWMTKNLLENMYIPFGFFKYVTILLEFKIATFCETLCNKISNSPGILGFNPGENGYKLKIWVWVVYSYSSITYQKSLKIWGRNTPELWI